ncbi:MAG: DUF2520 domain-containing protein [Spirochaetales bacterium]|nr:DUF2520 domain-containing protein [Spirochaetales bacterium]
MKTHYYGIVGSGRLASHLREYFHLSRIPSVNWNRKQDNSPPAAKLAACDVIILAVSDGAIEEMARHFKDSGKRVVHLSGANSFDGVSGCHPLMTFPEELFSLEKYRQIPFVLDEDCPEWSDLFPQWPNPHYRIKKELKSLYHSWCVMGGNFTTLLWHKANSVFSDELNLPSEILVPYLRQTTSACLSPGKEGLSGPLVRNDRNTMERNKAALGKTWAGIYEAFEKAYYSDPIFN